MDIHHFYIFVLDGRRSVLFAVDEIETSSEGHQNHHQHDEKEVNVNPADINDAEFYDFVQSTQQMMMEEIGKQKRQQQQQQLRSNRSEKQAAKSRQKAVASISQEEYEIRLLKARLAELEQASRG